MDIILHNYAQSPVAEKIRVVFGIKSLPWRSVEIPRLPPKPMLTRLTGGYRRTPVMQIGADVYCDSQCIARELERRFAEPSLFPDGEPGLAWGLSRWTDGPMFDHTVKIVLAAAGDALPQDFAQDRGRLYLGPDWARGLDRARADLPHLVAQMAGQLGWIERQLGTGRPFIAGDEPGLTDASVYHLVWFLRGRWSDGPAFLSPFANLCRWEDRVAALGHGQVTTMTADRALEIAGASRPQARHGTKASDPQGLTTGMVIDVVADVDGGEDPVRGELRFADPETVTIERRDPDLGVVCVHLPRVGYRISRVMD